MDDAGAEVNDGPDAYASDGNAFKTLNRLNKAETLRFVLDRCYANRRGSWSDSASSDESSLDQTARNRSCGILSGSSTAYSSPSSGSVSR
jgi:hypothetical protein